MPAIRPWRVACDFGEQSRKKEPNNGLSIIEAQRPRQNPENTIVEWLCFFVSPSLTME
jgi:hypothetical protein